MIRSMTRLQLYAELGHVSVVEPLLNNAYAAEENEIWRSGSEDSPHGDAWHTSFHSSEFPGDDPYACGRKAVYTLAGPPPPEPITPHLRAWFDIGKNLELDWVRRFKYYGVLLSNDQTDGDELQTGFADQEHWLTGASDAIILPPFWKKGHCVEIKTTKHEKVLAMLQGEEPPKSHAKYLRQTGAYIGLSYESKFSPLVLVCRHSGIRVIPEIGRCRGEHDGICDPYLLQVQPPEDGTLIYSSREEPMTTVSFYVHYDAEFMSAGRAKLAQWRDDFLANRIPEHPRENEKAKWSVSPCDFCDFKKSICKPDYQKKIKALDESHIKTFAPTIRPDYDFDAMVAAVRARWIPEESSK